MVFAPTFRVEIADCLVHLDFLYHWPSRPTKGPRDDSIGTTQAIPGGPAFPPPGGLQRTPPEVL